MELENKIIENMLQSYNEIGGINHIDGVNLPSRNIIEELTTDILRLLFPGFYEEKPIRLSNLHEWTSELVRKIRYNLTNEILKSLEYCATDERTTSDSLKDVAKSVTDELLLKLPQIRHVLQTDVEAAYDGDPAAFSHEEVIVAYPFIQAIGTQRVAHELYKKNIPFIPRIMTEWAHSKTGIDLHPGAEIGSYFFIDHGTGTIVGETCVIGNHVKMYHGITLGAKSTSGGQQLRGKKRHPVIEDHVTIYPGATILGGETIIGAGSTIGGNVFLTHSVPPNSLVIFEGLTTRILNKSERPPMPPPPPTDL